MYNTPPQHQPPSNPHPPQYQQPSPRPVGRATDTSVTPWRFVLGAVTSRFGGIFLAVVDACVSYRGILAMGSSQSLATLAAFLIAIFQALIALVLTSGINIADEFQARFFGGTGQIGQIQRGLGLTIMGVFIAVYIYDIWSNFAAFQNGQPIDFSQQGIFQAGLYFLLACLVTFGDELAHILADILDSHNQRNQAIHRAKVSEDRLQNIYWRERQKIAVNQAKLVGRQSGQNWKP